MNQKILIFDMYNLIFRTLFESHRQDPEDTEFDLWKHIIVSSFLNSIKTFSADRVIFAMDSKLSWRKEYYVAYKANRKDNRDKSDLDFKKFFLIMDEFFSDMKESFTNIFFLEVEKCEGDDIIGVLANELNGDYITIISTDSDFIQLLEKQNVRLYNPKKRQYVESINPAKDLEIKIVMGDKGDNIPPIKPRIGPKTVIKVMSELDVLFEDEQIRDNYIRNKTLIDLKNIPSPLKKKIKENFEEYEIKTCDMNKVSNLFVKNKMRRCYENISSYSQYLKRLS